MTSAVALSEKNLQWLQELPGSVAASDLDETYGFPHPLNQSRELAKELPTSNGSSGDHLLWWIKFYGPERQEILESPLARKLYKNSRLSSSRENGPIAHNALLLIEQPFRRQGFAKRVYAAEAQLYKKWGVKEIHIDARDEGLIVWVKKFGFLPRLPEALATQYDDWASKRPHAARQPPSLAADYPPEFLRSLNSLELYKVIP